MNSKGGKMNSKHSENMRSKMLRSAITSQWTSRSPLLLFEILCVQVRHKLQDLTAYI
jgi:hypothetical protein